MKSKNRYILLLMMFTTLFTTTAQASDPRFAQAKQLMDKKNYAQAVPLLFKMGYGSPNKMTQNQRVISRQWLGVALMRSGYYQAAAFPLISTMGQGSVQISEKSLVTLIQIADQLKDKSLLNYAVSKLDVNITKALSKEILFSKLAEAFLSQDQLAKAEENYLKVLEINPKNEGALYQLGLFKLKQNELKKAYNYFEKIESLYEDKSIFDAKKSVASLAIARTFYQAKQWKNAAEYYRDIPKNHEFYRQSQFELAWAQFRSLNFRGSLSTIETLQTPFYETYYDPESLLLRITILLFICQSEDLDAAVQKYETSFFTFHKDIDNWIKKNVSSADILKIINQTNLNLKLINAGYKPKLKTALPFYFVRTILDEKKIKTQVQLIAKIKKEKLQYKKSAYAKNKALATFFDKIYANRLQATQKKLIADFRKSVVVRLGELKDYNSQFELIRYEVLSSKKELLKFTSKLPESEKNDLLNANNNSDYYTENGFRYWPFKGEYWIDEIGNYQYIGTNRCVRE